MSDLVQRLRDSATQARALDRAALLNEAADEIERLRLTVAELEAVRVARDAYADDDGNAECEEIAAVLSGLLERTK